MLLPLLLNLDSSVPAREQVLWYIVGAVVGAGGGADVVSRVLDRALVEEMTQFGDLPKDQAYVFLREFAPTLRGSDRSVLDRARAGLAQSGAADTVSVEFVS